MKTWDLPSDFDVRYLIVTKEQFAAAIGESVSEVERLQEEGTVICAETPCLRLADNLDLRAMTVTQKQFAQVVGLSPARVNQLVKGGGLVPAPAARKGRLMFIASMENFYKYCR